MQAQVYLLLLFTGISESLDYWIIPHPDHPCPQLTNSSKCLNISQLATVTSELSTAMSANIYFASGKHVPSKTGWIALTLTGSLLITGDPQEASVIECTEYQVGFLIDSVRTVKINHLRMRNCGYDTTDTPPFVLKHNNFREDSARLNTFAAMLFVNSYSLTINNTCITNSVAMGVIILEPSSVVSITNSELSSDNIERGSMTNRGNFFSIVSWTVTFYIENIIISGGFGSSKPLGWSGIYSDRYISGGLTFWQISAHTLYIFLQNVTLENSTSFKGGAMYLTSTNSMQKTGCQGDTILHIDDCTFQNNTAEMGGAIFREYNFQGWCLWYFDTEYSGMYITNSAFMQNTALQKGGSICFELGVKLQNGQDKVPAFTMTITQTTFSRNQAKLGAAVFTSVHMESIVYSELIPSGNNASYWLNVSFTINNATFKNNAAETTGGSLYFITNERTIDSIINIRLTITESEFTNNSAYEGSAIAIQSTKLKQSGLLVNVRNSFFKQNYCPWYQSHGSMSVVHLSEVQYQLFEDTTIESNPHCRAIYSNMSQIEFKGDIYIKNHSSQYGAGLFLDCNPLSPTHNTSMLLLNGSTRVNLVIDGNHAFSYGGGIAVHTGCSLPERCFFHAVANKMLQATITMDGNTAVIGGNSIFGGYLEHCTIGSQILNFTAFDSLFNISEMWAYPSVVASQPYKVCICDQNFTQSHKCEFKYRITTFPGQTFQIPAVAASDFNNSFPSVIRASLSSDVAKLQDVQVIQQVGLFCKNLSYAIFTSRLGEEVSMTLEADSAFKSGATFPESTQTKIHVFIKTCPFGFDLDLNMYCGCANDLKTAGITCDIDEIAIRKALASMWVGNFSNGIAVHNNCPLDFCKPDYFNVDPYNQQEQCDFNRSGVLCGACCPGLGLALGTSQCKQCSDIYLLLLIPFALAGVLLILLLLKCNLTVSVGTLHGLIFYANILQANRSQYFANLSSKSFFSTLLSVCIAWINLDLGIETCLSSNLTAYTRTWLQFVFPIYIWFMVAVLIIVSRYSIAVSKFTGSNTVSVLATLFLLSYAKILRASLNVVSATVISNSNESSLVWLIDGNYTYFGWPHSILFVFTLMLLLAYILPFTFILLFSPILQAFSYYKVMFWVNKLAPLIDAYQGPYKKYFRFWTGLMLLIRLFLFTTFAGNIFGDPKINTMLIIFTTVALLCIWWRIGRIYRKRKNDYLEIFFILNLSITSTVTLYFQSTNLDIPIQETVMGIAIGSAMLVMTLIMFYHLSQMRIGIRISNKAKTVFQNKRNDIEEQEGRELPEVAARPKPTCTIIDIRKEPLLSEQDTQ